MQSTINSTDFRKFPHKIHNVKIMQCVDFERISETKILAHPH